MTEAESAYGADARGSSRAATIYDVARRAGVSHQTVSRLLGGFEGIRPQTRAKVESALRELDYRPNFAARSLTMGRSHRIGALTHEIDKIGPSRVIQGAAATARRAGYVLDIVTLDMADEIAIAKSLDLVRQQDLAGVLVLGSTDEMVSAFRKSRFRVPVHLSLDGEGRDEPAGQPLMLAELELLVDLLWRRRSPQVRAYRWPVELSRGAKPRVRPTNTRWAAAASGRSAPWRATGPLNRVIAPGSVCRATRPR